MSKKAGGVPLHVLKDAAVPARLGPAADGFALGQRPATMSDWQRMLANIYGSKNAFMSPEVVWLRVVERCGEIAEILRKEDYRDFRKVQALPSLMAWTIAFANKSGLVLDDCLWEKYPLICPYCAPDKPAKVRELLERKGRRVHVGTGSARILRTCMCVEGKYKPYQAERMLPYRSSALLTRPRSIDDWQAAFRGIYGAQHSGTSGTTRVSFHLWEEVCEVAREIRAENLVECRKELADVVSWILCLGTRAGRHSKSKEAISLDSALWRRYRGGVCYDCHNPRCRCS